MEKTEVLIDAKDLQCVENIDLVKTIEKPEILTDTKDLQCVENIDLVKAIEKPEILTDTKDLQKIDLVKELGDLLKNNITPTKIIFDYVHKKKYLESHIKLILYKQFDIPFEKMEYEIKTKRMYQTKFRNIIIERYKQCIISNYPENECHAVHIIPYVDEEQFDENNGLLMNKIFHDYFDKYNFSINPTTKKIESNITDPKSTLYKYIDQEITTLIPEKTWSYIKEHYEIYCLKNKKT